MKKLSGLIFGFGLFVVSAQAGTSDIIYSLTPDNNCVIRKIDGERVPFPLQKANTRYELAEGETYILNGSIVNVNGNSYLEVDLVSQPWLATQKMLRFPYLLLDLTDYNQFNRYEGRPVQVAIATFRNSSPNPEQTAYRNLKAKVILPPSRFNTSEK